LLLLEALEIHLKTLDHVSSITSLAADMAKEVVLLVKLLVWWLVMLLLLLPDLLHQELLFGHAGARPTKVESAVVVPKRLGETLLHSILVLEMILHPTEIATIILGILCGHGRRPIVIGSSLLIDTLQSSVRYCSVNAGMRRFSLELRFILLQMSRGATPVHLRLGWVPVKPNIRDIIVKSAIWFVLVLLLGRRSTSHLLQSC
jgi:hypothetical protein